MVMIEFPSTLLGFMHFLLRLIIDISYCMNKCSALVFHETTLHATNWGYSNSLRCFMCDPCLVFGNNILSFQRTKHIRQSWDRLYNANPVCTSSVFSALLRKKENLYGTLMVIIWTKTKKGFDLHSYIHIYPNGKSRDVANSVHVAALMHYICCVFVILSLCCRYTIAVHSRIFASIFNCKNVFEVLKLYDNTALVLRSYLDNTAMVIRN